MPRTRTHKTETATRHIFEETISSFSDSSLSISEGDLLFREVGERDYGVDGELEIFSSENITGKIARIQLKGTKKVIRPLKTADFVSCPGVSKSSLGYCRTKNITFILVYISKVDKVFYYCDLQFMHEEVLLKMENKDEITVRIPYENNSKNLSMLVRIINGYYDHIEKNEKTKIVSERKQAVEKDMVNNKESKKSNDNLWNYPGDITNYVIEDHQNPTDGEHKMVDSQGNTVKIGYWKDGELEKGAEYNHLIQITCGSLIFKLPWGSGLCISHLLCLDHQISGLSQRHV